MNLSLILVAFLAVALAVIYRVPQFFWVTIVVVILVILRALVKRLTRPKDIIL